MSPVVRIDDDVFAILQSVSTPLVDTPSDAIRKLAVKAGMRVSSDTGKRALATKLPITPHQAFREPILSTLRDLGGKAKTGQIKPALYKKMKDQLTDADKKVLKSSNEDRWWNAAQWERYFMTREGLLKTGSARGWWELNHDGRH